MTDNAPSAPDSVFTLIIRGDLPGRFVWRDERVVAFLTIAPITAGHVLVVPVDQVDKWTDLPNDLWLELNAVAIEVGRAIEDAFDCVRVGTIIAGLEVPHCHLHLLPINAESDLSFAKANPNVPAEELDAAAEAIRAALRARGHATPG
ncbi:MAG: HIT family protein [Microthrixaceae bacterium]|nr:HIT family protein [Microthrixaceae bacterium]